MTKQHTAAKIFGSREAMEGHLHGQERSYYVLALLYAVAVMALAVAWLARRRSLPIELATDAASFCMIGWAQYSIGNAMHEGVHRNLLNRKSDLLVSMLTAWPIGLTMSYRQTHLDHHRYLGTDTDPDYRSYSSFPRSKAEMLSRIAWSASGVAAVLQFLKIGAPLPVTPREPRPGSRKDVIGLLLTQLVIFLTMATVFKSPMFYICLWIAPVATFGKLLATCRFLCEHGDPKRDWVVRTIHGPRWQTWIMGAYDFNYHGEHHLFPHVPFAGLRDVYEIHTQYRVSAPDYIPLEGRFQVYNGGYLSLLFEWFRSLPIRSRQAS
jgi:fatty acid desaturase